MDLPPLYTLLSDLAVADGPKGLGLGLTMQEAVDAAWEGTRFARCECGAPRPEPSPN